MPFALLLIGLWLLIAGVRNTQDQLFTLVKGDFTGSDNFIFWFLAILAVGALGYVPKLKPISIVFLTLILVVLFINKGSATGIGGGFFQQFLSGIQGTTSGTSPTPTAASLQPGIDALRNRILGTIQEEQQLMNQGSGS